jgi:hypothetical protein
MIDQISTHEYIILKKETRDALHATFGIPQTGHTETVTDSSGKGRVISDGTTYKDLESLTFEKLLTFLGQADPEDNVHSLFTKVVNILEKPPVDLGIKIENAAKDIAAAEEKSNVENPSIDNVKCAKCEFRASTNKVMKEHFKNFHKDYN